MARPQQVLVGADAAQVALQFLIAAQQFSTTLAGISTSAAVLADRAMWSGTAADRFRVDQQAMALHLRNTGTSVLRMAAGALEVIQTIDRDDTLGATAPVRPVGGPSTGSILPMVTTYLAGSGGKSKAELGAEIGNDIGQILAGMGLLVAGTGGEILGFSLDATGVGAVLGVPANVVSAAAIATGAGLVVHGATDLGKNLAAMTSSSSSSSGGGGVLSNRVRPPQDGDREYIVDDPAVPGRTITDVDHIDGGTLWEEKTATGQDPRMDTNSWISKNILRKLDSYVQARPYLTGYEDAPLGIDFTKSGSTPEFRTAVENAVKDWEAKNPGIPVTVRWAP